MIKKMIEETKKFLPLRIQEVNLDSTTLNINDDSWSFTTLSSWRLSTLNDVILGCFDNHDTRIKIHEIKNLDITQIDYQEEFLKIDPVFVLSNGWRLEIFTTNTYKPWVFSIKDFHTYIGSPNQSTHSSSNKNLGQSGEKMMMENFLQKIKKHLPIQIKEVICDDTVLNIYGDNWGFSTLSAWRISNHESVLLGCFDNDISQIFQIKKLSIVDVCCQNQLLKTDPVFILSNNWRLEIFSTDTYDPWVLHVGDVFS